GRGAGRRGTRRARAGAVRRGGADRGGGQRPGGGRAVPGVADVGEPVAAGAGRWGETGAGLQGGRRGPVQAVPGAAARAGGGAGGRPGRVGLAGSVLDAGPDRGADAGPVRGGLHPGRAGCAAAPDRVERAGASPPGRRAGRGGHRRLAGGGLAGDKRTAADLGAWLCFEDESGQGLRPPKGRPWGRRGRTPVVTVTAQGSKRVSVAALVATTPGTPGRARLIYRTHVDRGSGKGRRKGFAETEYARLLDGAHQELRGPIVLIWDNLPTHVNRKMRQLTAARSWLTVYQLPAYAPELNPVEMSLP